MFAGRTIARVFMTAGLGLAVALGGTASWLPGSTAIAQQQEGASGGGLLRLLFGSRPTAQEAPPTTQIEQQQPRRQQQRATSQRRPQTATSSTPAVAAVEKSEDASKVLVMGDFVAGGLGEGLEVAFAENADIVVTARTNGSSGLVRDDFFNWPENITGFLEEEEPDIVILMIGANDRQQMIVDGRREEPRSEAWMSEYEARIRKLATAVREHEAHLVWVGMVPFRFRSMTSDMIAFNDLYRRVTEEAGGEYIDVWGGFVDEEGDFASHGPDMNGQPAQLRAGDGINITRAGKRKLAFFVEKPLNRLLADGAPPALADHGPELPLDFDHDDIDLTRIERTQPVSLGEAGLLGGGELLGGRATGAQGSAGARASREEVDATRSVPGRADNFSLRRPRATESDRPADL
ncbi:MAG: SGNH/GDSL hydrolase family protein [Rhizobiaceae bacterium]